ncbi:MAG: type II toxin-antitoxin system YhaV family toxin [Burkholderiales bacterium]
MKLAQGWRLFAFEPFGERLAALKREVERLQVVPSNPDHSDFRVGHTLGAGYAHWRRVKRGLPARYRLFYRFSTRPMKIIVYAWLNDEATLRKTGAKTDVYAVFRRMLARGEVPSDIQDLTKRSRDLGE